MHEKAFAGLGISYEDGVTLLKHSVAALGKIISERMRDPGAVPDRSVRLASGGLAYFVIGKDLVPDDAPNGLVDDLAILGMVLKEVDPEAASKLPLETLQKVLENLKIPPLSVPDHPFLGMANLAHPATVFERARTKVQNLDQVGANRENVARRSAGQVYMGMMMMAYWASQKTPRAPRKAPRRRPARQTED